MKVTYTQPDEFPAFCHIFMLTSYDYNHAFYERVGVDRGQETKRTYEKPKNQNSKERLRRVI